MPCNVEACAAAGVNNFPTVWRNLGIACFNKRNDAKKHSTAMKKLLPLDQTDARIFMELDQLYKRLNKHRERTGIFRTAS